MNRWSELFLGVIALATVAMAVIQILAVVAAGRLARRLDRLADQVERELKPMFGHLNAIARDAARATAVAGTQVERADRLFADLSQRIDQTLNSIQTAIAAPAREGRALLSAFRAGLRVIRGLRDQARPRRARGEDEDALFI